MSLKSTIKSFTNSDGIIYVAPILLVASLLHIFSAEPVTHKFGQLEIMGALIIISYYIWDVTPKAYAMTQIRSKQIELIICYALSVISALVLMPPLLTWQYFNLYRATTDRNHIRNILIAVISLWVGVGILFTSALSTAKQKMEMANNPVQESVMPEVLVQ